MLSSNEEEDILAKAALVITSILNIRQKELMKLRLDKYLFIKEMYGGGSEVALQSFKIFVEKQILEINHD